MSTLSEAQNIMLTRMESHCHHRQTQVWTGNNADLDKIGGRDLLYELEQAGVVTINRIGEQWIIRPDRYAGVNTPPTEE